MASLPKIVCVVGTRPDAIKTAPVVLELRKFHQVETVLVATGQHREMLTQALGAFGLEPDVNLDIMQVGQTLADVTTRALSGLDAVLNDLQPQWVLGQGDTTTTFVAGLGAFYRQIPFGHVEAGLRTDTVWNPFPEEFNRRAVGLFAQHHYAPTSWSADNLRKEGISEDKLFVTGNTGIDAVKMVAAKSAAVWYPDRDERIILLTSHRRENWGQPQEAIARAARRLVETFPDTRLVVAMHKNPAVRATLKSALDGVDRVHMIEPPDYFDFVKLMERSDLILTDSGGVQEEAPAFGRPVLVLRETTERPEGVHAGVAKLVGTDEELIVNEGSKLLQDPAAYATMSQASSPYGDGRAAERIRYHLLRSLDIASPEVL